MAILKPKGVSVFQNHKNHPEPPLMAIESILYTKTLAQVKHIQRLATYVVKKGKN